MSDVERLELYEKLERSEGRIVALEKQVMLYCLFQSSFYKIRCCLLIKKNFCAVDLGKDYWNPNRQLGGNHAFFCRDN